MWNGVCGFLNSWRNCKINFVLFLSLLQFETQCNSKMWGKFNNFDLFHSNYWIISLQRSTIYINQCKYVCQKWAALGICCKLFPHSHLLWLALCRFMWLFRPLEVVEEYLHCLQEKGFSPMWVNLCVFKWLATLHL